MSILFFFQAEDGIRDLTVTGVQTCALPILSFDLSSRTITVADITGESAAQPSSKVKIASFTASGVSQPDAMRFSADTIEATGIEIEGAMAVQAAWRFAYKAPQLAIKDYSGPAGPQRPL